MRWPPRPGRSLGDKSAAVVHHAVSSDPLVLLPIDGGATAVDSQIHDDDFLHAGRPSLNRTHRRKSRSEPAPGHREPERLVQLPPPEVISPASSLIAGFGGICDLILAIKDRVDVCINHQITSMTTPAMRVTRRMIRKV